MATTTGFEIVGDKVTLKRGDDWVARVTYSTASPGRTANAPSDRVVMTDQAKEASVEVSTLDSQKFGSDLALSSAGTMTANQAWPELQGEWKFTEMTSTVEQLNLTQFNTKALLTGTVTSIHGNKWSRIKPDGTKSESEFVIDRVSNPHSISFIRTTNGKVHSRGIIDIRDGKLRLGTSMQGSSYRPKSFDSPRVMVMNYVRTTTAADTASTKAKDEELWRVPLGSQTMRAPVVHGDHVYIGTNNEHGYVPRYPSEVDLGALLCFRKSDGKFLWQHSNEKLASGRIHDWPLQGITSRPCVEGDRLWYITNRGEIVCLDTNGFRDGKNDGPVNDEPNEDNIEADVIWRLDMMEKLGVRPHNLSTCTVAVWNDVLFAVTGNGVNETHLPPLADAPSFIAVNKKTGEVLWTDSSPGQNVLHGQWGSPVVAQLAGKTQVIFPGGDGWLYSFEPRGTEDGKGKLIWKCDCNFKESVWKLGGQGTRNNLIHAPTVHNGLLYIAMGQDPEHGEGPGSLLCIAPSGTGDVSPDLVFNKQDDKKPITHRRVQACVSDRGDFLVKNPNSKVVWQFQAEDVNGNGKFEIEEQMSRSLSTITIKNDLLFVSDSAGILHCLNRATGKQHWSYDMLSTTYCTPTIVGDEIFLPNEDGDVCVFGCSANPDIAIPSGEPIRRKEFDTSIYGSIVTDNDMLFIAAKDELIALRHTPGFAGSRVNAANDSALAGGRGGRLQDRSTEHAKMAEDTLDKHDNNRDGVIDRNEAPLALKRAFDQIDISDDGTIDSKELRIRYMRSSGTVRREPRQQPDDQASEQRHKIPPIEFGLSGPAETAFKCKQLGLVEAATISVKINNKKYPSGLKIAISHPKFGSMSAVVLVKNAPEISQPRVKMKITDEDFKCCQSGTSVTKVSYEPRVIGISPSGKEILSSTRLDPGVDPLAEAQRRGTPLVVMTLIPSASPENPDASISTPAASKATETTTSDVASEDNQYSTPEALMKYFADCQFRNDVPGCMNCYSDTLVNSYAISSLMTAQMMTQGYLQSKIGGEMDEASKKNMEKIKQLVERSLISKPPAIASAGLMQATKLYSDGFDDESRDSMTPEEGLLIASTASMLKNPRQFVNEFYAIGGDEENFEEPRKNRTYTIKQVGEKTFAGESPDSMNYELKHIDGRWFIHDLAFAEGKEEPANLVSEGSQNAKPKRKVQQSLTGSWRVVRMTDDVGGEKYIPPENIVLTFDEFTMTWVTEPEPPARCAYRRFPDGKLEFVWLGSEPDNKPAKMIYHLKKVSSSDIELVQNGVNGVLFLHKLSEDQAHSTYASETLVVKQPDNFEWASREVILTHIRLIQRDGFLESISWPEDIKMLSSETSDAVKKIDANLLLRPIDDQSFEIGMHGHIATLADRQRIVKIVAKAYRETIKQAHEKASADAIALLRESHRTTIKDRETAEANHRRLLQGGKAKDSELKLSVGRLRMLNNMLDKLADHLLELGVPALGGSLDLSLHRAKTEPWSSIPQAIGLPNGELQPSSPNSGQ